MRQTSQKARVGLDAERLAMLDQYNAIIRGYESVIQKLRAQMNGTARTTATPSPAKKARAARKVVTPAATG
jgi:hypothetical protein